MLNLFWFSRSIKNSSFICIAFIFTMCRVEPEAKFQILGSNHNIDVPVSYNNLSSNTHSYQWDFGDGTTSIKEQPVHIYKKTGIYLVSLTAFSKNRKNSNTVSQEITIADVDDQPYLGDYRMTTVEFIGHQNQVLPNDPYFWSKQYFDTLSIIEHSHPDSVTIINCARRFTMNANIRTGYLRGLKWLDIPGYTDGPCAEFEVCSFSAGGDYFVDQDSIYYGYHLYYEPTIILFGETHGYASGVKIKS